MQPKVNRSQTFLTLQDVSEAADYADPCAAVYAAAKEIENDLKLGSPTYYVDEITEEIREAQLQDATELPYFVLEEVTRADRVLRFAVQVGKESDHDRLVARDGSGEPMTKRAAVRRLYAWMIFPAAGDHALLVSETRGRTYIGALLVEWLTRTLQRNAVSLDDKGKRQEEPWLNWKLEARIDGARLDGLLNGSSNFAIRLRRKTVTATGGRSSYDLELVQYGLKKTPVDKVFGVIQAMYDRIGVGSETHRREQAAKDVIELVDGDGVGGLEFNDGEISFLENGKTQTINAETVDRLFIYPLGDKHRLPDEVFEEAAPVVKRIAAGLSIQLD